MEWKWNEINMVIYHKMNGIWKWTDQDQSDAALDQVTVLKCMDRIRHCKQLAKIN